MEESYIDSRIYGLLNDEITRINNHKSETMVYLNGEPHLELKDYQPLKKAYDEAKADRKESFTYEGEFFNVGFARYMLEYLKMTIDAKKRENE